jgi:hypothetical protein
MTRRTDPTIDDLADRTADLERAAGAGTGIHAVGPGDDYPSAAEFEARHGHPPEEHDGIVIRVPEAAEEY